jgi:hypothetical protein
VRAFVDRRHPLPIPQHTASVTIDVIAPDIGNTPPESPTLPDGSDEVRLNADVHGYENDYEQDDDHRYSNGRGNFYALDPSFQRTASPEPGSSSHCTAVDDVSALDHALPVRQVLQPRETC